MTSQAYQPANLLEVALVKAADDPASRPLFLRELLDSKVLIVPANKPKIVNGVVPQNTTLSLATIQFGGRVCVPFYTSESRLPTGTEYLTLDSRDFFDITKGSYLVMNPGNSYGKEFFPDEVARMLDGSLFEPRERFVATKEMKVLIGHPKDYPTELIGALSRLYGSSNLVKRAWVAFYHNTERDAEGGLLICLEVSNVKDMERMSAESGIVIEGCPKPQKFVDLVRYENTGVAGYFTDKKPFYQKSAVKSFWRSITG